jgi:hypothetical protein
MEATGARPSFGVPMTALTVTDIDRYRSGNCCRAAFLKRMNL